MTRIKRFAVLLQVALLCLLSSNRGATAVDAQASATATSAASEADAAAQGDAKQILELTNELLFKEIDFERFYLQYHQDGNKQPKYRRLRFFLLQQAAGSTSLTANLANMVETGKHFRTPANVSSKVFLDTNRVGLTGTILGGTSSAIELCSNGYTALRNKWTKHDPATARENGLTRIHEIDSLMARRRALVDQCRNPDARSIYLAEGSVLKTFRDWCVYEFADAYCDVHSLQASSNVFYAVDISAYSLSMAAYILGIKADKNPRQNYPALHISFVGDSFFTSEAPLSTLAYKRIYAFWYNSLAKSLGEKPHDAETTAKTQMVHLEYLAANADDKTLAAIGPIAARLTVYSFWSNRYDKYIDHRMNEMRRQSRIALQGQVTGPLLGATGLAQDTMNAVGLYRYANNAYKQNALAFAGSATATCSALASVGLTGWWFMDQILDDRRNTRDKVLPEFLLQDRLKTLAVLEDMLRGTSQE